MLKKWLRILSGQDLRMFINSGEFDLLVGID